MQRRVFSSFSAWMRWHSALCVPVVHASARHAALQKDADPHAEQARRLSEAPQPQSIGRGHAHACSARGALFFFLLGAGRGPGAVCALTTPQCTAAAAASCARIAATRPIQ